MSTPTSARAPVGQSAHRVTTRALGWLRHNHQRGALPPGTTEEIADPDNAYKPLGEIALAASIAVREGLLSAHDADVARDLLDFAWGEYRHGDLLYERQLRHTMMTDPLEMYSPFIRAGYRHEGLDELLAHLSRLTAARSVEHFPNRRLAVANAQRLLGLDQDTDWAALTDATWLGRLPEPWAIDWFTAYAVTHTAFHLTDFGALPGELPVRIQDYLHTWLPVWVEVWQENHQWDLLAELLIVGACLTEPWSDPEAWELLAGAQREDGLVPRDGQPVDNDPARAFLDHHHPTLVSVIAGTLALSRTPHTATSAP